MFLSNPYMHTQAYTTLLFSFCLIGVSLFLGAKESPDGRAGWGAYRDLVRTCLVFSLVFIIATITYLILGK